MAFPPHILPISPCRYDFGPFLRESLSFLHKHFPDALSPDPTSPCYLLMWLGLADDLQLEEVWGWYVWCG